VVQYAGILGLLLVFRMTRALVPGAAVPARLKRFESLPVLLLALLIVASAISAGIRGWWSWYVYYYSVIALLVLLLLWFAATVPRTMSEVRRVVMLMLASSAAIPVLVLLFASRLDVSRLGKVMAIPHSVVSLNVLAAHVSTLAAVAVGMATAARRSLTRIGLLVVAGGLLAVLVFTRSRGAWLGFGVAFLYIVLQTRSAWALGAVGLATAGVLSTDVLRSGLSVRVGATSLNDPSLWGRLLLWKYALDLFRSNWLLGVGWENFRYVKQLYGYPVPMSIGTMVDSNNLYLEFAVDLGVLGLASLLVLLVGSIIRLGRTARSHACNGEDRALALGLAAGLLAFGTHGLLDCVIWQHGAFMLLALLLGLAIATCRLAARDLTQAPAAVSPPAG
jgi:O-antigen ligase